MPAPNDSECLSDPGPAPLAAEALSKELGITVTMADVLSRRGYVAGETTTKFLSPKLAHLTAPEGMADRDAAAQRIARAVRSGERIVVFGDYDCDGITSTAILTGVIRALGGEVVPLVASRFEGGYGFSEPALRKVLDATPGLLVTCDCGSSDHERLAAARAAGVDAIVIDHHLVPTEPLHAFAFLNPNRPECGFPYKGLASCGLALSVAAAVRQALGASLDLRPWLDLVAIGTVADVAPLTRDNRVLVRSGLAALAAAARPGVRALLELSRLDGSLAVTAEDVAFKLAPRINAPGRLGDPADALTLLLAGDIGAARGLASRVEQLQEKRRALQATMLQEAIADIEAGGFATQPAIVVGRQGWHPGVVGIVAGRLASRYGRPAIVVALEGETGRGSVRGPSGARLHDALSRCKEALVGFGGHQAAAGLEVRSSRLDALRDLWCQAFASSGDVAEGSSESAESAKVERPLDAGATSDGSVRLDARDDPSRVVADLASLEPCGEGNRAPMLVLRDAVVKSGKDVKGHLKLDVRWGRYTLGAFGFEMGHRASSLPARAHLLGTLRRDGWKGGSAVELKLDRMIVGD